MHNRRLELLIATHSPVSITKHASFGTKEVMTETQFPSAEIAAMDDRQIQFLGSINNVLKEYQDLMSSLPKMIDSFLKNCSPKSNDFKENRYECFNCVYFQVNVAYFFTLLYYSSEGNISGMQISLAWFSKNRLDLCMHVCNHAFIYFHYTGMPAVISLRCKNVSPKTVNDNYSKKKTA